jgi:Icc-related predicted phosphoesterase
MAGPMKVLAVSDRVLDHLYCTKLREKYPDIKLIIGCGDLPYYYLDFLISSLDVPLAYVLGNHDGGPQYTADKRQLTSVDGGTYLHGQVVNINGLLLAGLDGSMRYRPRAPYMYTEAEMRGQIARLIPSLLWNRQKYGRYLDVLVTHSPPFGIHDRADLPHTGFKVFLQFMRVFKPRFLLHGHIHLYRRDTVRHTKVGETEVINVYPYRILDIPVIGS